MQGLICFCLSILSLVQGEVLSLVFDDYWGTAIGGPNEAARAGVRFLAIAEKKLIRQTNRIWEQLGYPMEGHKLLD